jgi:RHS repeat-associated protein
MIGAKWMDMLVGVDLHFVLVPTPAGPIPTPLPHPFVGIVYDPAGLVIGSVISAGISAITGAPFTGPVLINGMPAASTGIQGTNKPVMPHVPMPPGTAWAMVPSAPRPPVPGRPPGPPSPTPTPQNDASMITGSKTVHISGTNACRLGDLAMSCAEPVRLPSSTCIAVPLGSPVIIGGPPALDFTAALMSMIRTKWISDQLHAFFGAKPGSWGSKIICFFTGHPVDVASGMVVTDHTDVVLRGSIPVVVQRTYYSRSTYDGPLGRGWAHTYDEFITVERRKIVLHAGDGRDIYFYPSVAAEHLDGAVIRNRAERLALTRTPDGFGVSGTDGLTKSFAFRGRRDGALSLARIEDRDGSRIELEYDERGSLRHLVDTEGRQVRFLSGVDGRVATIDVPHPDDPKSRAVIARFSYSDGDLVQVADALGASFHYVYKNHLLVQERDRAGRSFYFAYDGFDQDAWCVRTWGDEGAYDHVLTYDKQGHVTVVEDSLGRTTTYLANDDGLVVKKLDPAGGVREYKWDHDWHIVAETDPAGGVCTYTYDEAGSILSATDQSERTFAYERDALGRCTAFVDAANRRWLYEYNGGMRRTAFTTPAGETSRTMYDAHGRITGMIDAEGRASAFRRRTLPDGSLRVAVSGPLGANRHLRYDGWGRLLELVDLDGGRFTLTYDLGDRLIGVALPDGSERLNTYDGEGRLTVERLPDGRTFYYRHGVFRNPTEATDGAGTTVRFVRDTENHLVEVVRANGQRYMFEHDACGRIVASVAFDGRRRAFRYDRAGRMVESTDAVGRPTGYGYDSGGRLVQVTGWDGYNASYSYDSNGLLVAASNDAGEIAFSRDACGRVVAETAADTALRWTFDRAGIRTGRTFEAGRHRGGVEYALDGAGELQELRGPSLGVSFSTTPDARSQRTALLRGTVLEERFDTTGRPAAQRVTHRTGVLVSREYAFDAAGDLAERRDSARGTSRYRHDGQHRLATMTDRNGSSAYVRDANGALVRLADRAFELDAAGRVVATAEQSMRYDADGRLVFRIGRASGERTRYTYDSRSRLRRVERWVERSPSGEQPAEFVGDPVVPAAEIELTEFDYDAFGRLVTKRTPGGETRYRWDGLRLALELPSVDAAPWEYHFKERSFEPLCRTRGEQSEFFICDQAGVPQEIVDGYGESVWRGTLDPFGEIRSQTEGRDSPFRLQGQYAEPATGLAYSGTRFYDPTLGRYLTPDPLGLFGSPDTYAYTANPLALVDPWALYIVALGRTNKPGSPTLLKDFAAAHPPAVTWGAVPNLPEPHDVGWGKWAHDLIGNSEGTRFNLDGIPDVKAAFDRGKQLADTEAMLMARGLEPGLAMSGGAHVTDAELYQLLRRDGPLDDSLKKFLDKEGNEVNIEDLRKQCGV